MLADEIIAARGGRRDREMHGGITAFAAEIMQAQRFVFESDSAAAITQVATTRPEAFVEALPLGSPPFSRVWIEYASADAFGQAPNRDEVRRMGALVTCEAGNPSRFTCFFAICHGDGKNRTAMLEPSGWSVDLLSPVAQPWGDALSLQPNSAVRKLLTHCAVVMSPHAESWFNGLSASVRERCRPGWSENAQMFLRSTLSALCLLNTRNLVTSETTDLAKKNKARRLLGKPPLLSFNEVRISLSKRDRLAATSLGLGTEEIRRHVVRGHFKVRQGKLFWWRPHLRGSASLGHVVHTGYSVKGAPQGLAA